MTRYTLIEFMPPHLRASHVEARNSGRFPQNGAERVYIEGEVDSRSLHPRWAEVIEDSIDELPEGETAESYPPDDALAPYSEPDEEG